MCASSRTVRSKTLKLPRTAKELDEAMQDLLSKLPLADAAVMMGGFFAGYHGMTPMTALLGGIGKIGVAAPIAGNVIFDMIDPFGFFHQKAAERAAATTPEDIARVEHEMAMLRWSMACVGLVEAYMMTRPGALQGVLNFVGQMAQATAEGIDAIIPG